jgi:hypothetical protein
VQDLHCQTRAIGLFIFSFFSNNTSVSTRTAPAKGKIHDASDVVVFHSQQVFADVIVGFHLVLWSLQGKSVTGPAIHVLHFREMDSIETLVVATNDGTLSVFDTAIWLRYFKNNGHVTEAPSRQSRG